MNIIITGGSGFIGSNFFNMHVPEYPEHTFINIDKLTYAANSSNLASIKGMANYRFEKADVTNFEQVDNIFNKYQPDMVIHFAAESHVDRSISGPAEFIKTNIIGTFNLLETCRSYWLPDNNLSRTDEIVDSKLFIHVSTDEVYGSLGLTGKFTERTAYDPRSPYSASKASSDHLVRAYYHTYRLPVISTNCSNNYGPYQFPEKLIPLMIINALEGKPLPVYGAGENIRDWLYVEDHCRALWLIAEKGRIGETYNIGGSNEWRNIDLVNLICEYLAEETGVSAESYKQLITFVKDRPGHDYRYAIDSSKLERELGWQQVETFETGIRKTIKWYLRNQEWVAGVKSGDYIKWLTQNYDQR